MPIVYVYVHRHGYTESNTALKGKGGTPFSGMNLENILLDTEVSQ